ncbi:MAG TPA: PAS domain S-box protein [Casimicrobiaceae bacterium]
MKPHEPNRTQEVLRNAALAVSTAAGEGVFRELVRALAAILGVDIAFIALPKSGDSCTLRMLAFYADDRMIDDLEYPIAGTPCETVIGKEFRCYPIGLKGRFPLDVNLAELGIEGYAGYPLTDARGEAAGLMVVAARRPITEPELVESVLKIFAARAMVELERQRAEAALRASEEQYRAIFNASEDALILWDSTLRRVDINPAYERLYGWTREEVLGRGYETLAVPADYAEPRLDLVRRTLAGETCRVELESLRKNGGRFQADIRTIAVAHRGAPHVLAIVRDITARKQAETRHRELEAQLRQAQKMEAIGHLTGGIAHDFNNILTGIMGYLTLASEREAANRDVKLARHLQQAQHGATRARELIQQMLAFSRAQRGKPRAVSLAPLAEEAVELLGPSLPATVELRTTLEQDLPAVMVDPVQVEQILLNLCINARDAMDGAGKIAVGVRLAANSAALRCTSCQRPADGRYVELAVSDTGPGIAPQVLERMFEPFFSTKEVGRGSGMGLAMVHGIVHEHGGHVVVETSLGKGATFRVLLPALEGGPEMAAAQSPGTERARPLRDALDGRVLLVDDEQLVGEFMAELLGGWGLEVTVRRDPVEGKRWLAEDPARVDLVLTDQTMPSMTGLELARCVAALRPGLPVILYSGYAENIGTEELAQSGVRALLAKPVEPELLFAALADALRP